MAVNWVKIKNEYITKNTSQRELAKKYGVSATAVANRCKKENWTDKRKQHLSKVSARLEQKTIEKITEKESQRIVDGLDLMSDMLADIEKLRKKMINAIDMLDIEKPERTQVKYNDNGRTVVSDESGIHKADKIANVLTKMTRSIVDVVDSQKKYTDKSDEFDDDGLLDALASSVEEIEDDSNLLPSEDE